jgi:prepilin-type N-terminal cleavage/methylation domain-containing protein
MKTQKGFTLTELIITIGLLFIIFGLSSIAFLGSIRRPAQVGAVNILVTDLKSQQAKAMMGKGEHGINFAINSYSLTPDNFVVNLPEGFEFTNTQQVNFTAGTGETTPTEISVRDGQSTEITTLRINKHGATY